MRRLALGVAALVGSSSFASAGGPREPHGQCWNEERKSFRAPCGPGNEMCGPASPQIAKFHIMDRRGAAVRATPTFRSTTTSTACTMLCIRTLLVGSTRPTL
jgi:hypothetical protein